MSAAERLPGMFDEAEAAKRLGITKATLIRERVRGKIAYFRLGTKMIRYSEAELDEYGRRAPEDLDALVDRARAAKAPLTTEHGVYFLWRGDAVVYVGRTGNFIARLSQHMIRGKDFDSYTFVPVPEARVAATERQLIDRLRPELNILLNADRATKRRTR